MREQAHRRRDEEKPRGAVDANRETTTDPRALLEGFADRYSLPRTNTVISRQPTKKKISNLRQRALSKYV